MIDNALEYSDTEICVWAVLKKERQTENVTQVVFIWYELSVFSFLYVLNQRVFTSCQH